MQTIRSVRPLAIATVVAATVVLGACATPSGNDAGPSGAVNTFGAASADPTASASGQPSESAEASPSPLGSASTWTLAGTFEESGTVAQVLKVVEWDDGFVAIGERSTTEYLGAPGEPRLWISADGHSWSEATPELGYEDASVQAGSLLEDGRLMLIGFTGDVGAGGPYEPRAWASGDLETWTELELPFGDSPTAPAYAAGPVGHVVARERTIWFSTNGTDWEQVFEVDERSLQSPSAGDEGFVVMHAGDPDAQPSLLASGDGRQWFETEPRPVYNVAPFGGDWLGYEYSDEPPTIMLTRSANGLDWEAYQDVNELTPSDGPKAGKGMASEIQQVTFTSAAGTMVMTFSWNHCCAQLAQGVMVLSSTDATDWTELDLGANAFVSSSAANGDVVVLGGYLNRGQAAALWVRQR